MSSRVKGILAASSLAAMLAVPAASQQIISDLGGKVTGVREITVESPGAATVSCRLDGKPCDLDRSKSQPVTNNRAHFEIDFGSIPFPRVLDVTAFDTNGSAMGAHRVRVNPGGRSTYLDFIEPRSGAAVGVGTSAAFCVHTATGDSISESRLLLDDIAVPLAPIADARCDGTAFKGVLPAKGGYLEATVLTARGRAITESITINQDSHAFGESITVRLLRYLVRPVGRDGATVDGIAQEQFHVLEDRRELAIRAASPVADAPLDVAIVLDASQSTIGDAAMEQALVDSVLAMLDPVRDRAIVYAISTHPVALLPDWTGDRAAIEKALRAGLRLKPGFTSAYETLEDVLGQFQTTGDNGLAAGAILYMTDGADSMFGYKGSAADARRRDQILRYARSSGIQTYGIAVSLPMPANEVRCTAEARNMVNTEYLQELTQSTGGNLTMITLEANPTPFLREAERLAAEIHHLNEEKTEDSLKRAQKKQACLKFFVDEYKRQEAIALDPKHAQRIRDAIASAGEALRAQYLLEIEAVPDNVPRERRLEFSVEHPLVQAVKAPVGTYY